LSLEQLAGGVTLAGAAGRRLEAEQDGGRRSRLRVVVEAILPEHRHVAEACRIAAPVDAVRAHQAVHVARIHHAHMAAAQHVLAGLADIGAAHAPGANRDGKIVGDPVGRRNRDRVDRAEGMRMGAVSCRGEQIGIAKLAKADEFVTHRSRDQSFGKRVGRDGVDGAAATGIATAAWMMRLRGSCEKKHHG
jgi:hypothetical protein